MDERFHRVVVVGTSGAGKTTFATRWAEATGCKQVELDELFWGPNWSQTPNEEFCEKIRSETAGQRWVVAGNYTRARPIIWSRATSVIWLDFSFPLVFWRVFQRTIRRCWTKEFIFNGNQESYWKAFFSRDSILLWCVTSYSANRRKYLGQDLQNEYPALNFVRLTKPKESDELLNQIALSSEF